MSRKLTKSQDGIDRVDVVVKTRLTTTEIATLITSTFATAIIIPPTEDSDYRINGQTIKQILRNKKAAMDLLSETILIDGTVIPSYRVSDNHLHEINEVVFKRIEQLWSE